MLGSDVDKSVDLLYGSLGPTKRQAEARDNSIHINCMVVLLVVGRVDGCVRKG